ncbi:MAG: MBL fold metallo-hydrolase [Verrucomicrobiota bacterium]
MATKKTSSPRPAAPPRDYRVRIRMYRQGLGDCFLLSFRNESRAVTHVMIDCGVVLGTDQPEAVMKQIARNLKEETGGTIDVLIITHEHWDHLSGFSPGQAQKELAELTFNELWLAWTEDPTNDLANALRTERALKKAAAAATKKRLAKLGPKAKERLNRLSALMEFHGPDSAGPDGGEGAGGTEGALRFLKTKITRQRTFRPGQAPLTVPGLGGVRVYVMGPPEDKQKLHSTNPGKSQGYGLGGAMSMAEAFAAALGADSAEADPEKAQPFSACFRQPMTELARKPYRKPENAWRTVDEDWLAVGERLALQLDSDTNNTSLVLAFEFIDTEDVLLFVGDAQAGNWLSWDNYTWTVKDRNGLPKEVTAADLLARSVLYKVGHHGSHNATLREKGLERMTHPDLVAMMPVDEKVAHEKKGWMHMPLPQLCERLNQKCAAVIRVDRDEVSGVNPGAARITQDKLYFDCFL